MGENLDRAGCRVADLGGNLLAPGFLDVHTHGGAGVDINAAGCEDLSRLSAFFASQGVTGFLASILTDTEEATCRAIDRVCAFMDRPAPGAKCLGIHLEGPFLCLKYRGAMPPELLREGDAGLFQRYQERAGGRIRYMTVAPEVRGVPEMIQALRGQCVLAMGHTDADYESDKLLRANGFMKGPNSSNAGGGLNTTVNLRQIGGDGYDEDAMRCILGTIRLTTDGSIYVRFRNATTSTTPQFMMDYIEICPSAIYDNPFSMESRD